MMPPDLRSIWIAQDPQSLRLLELARKVAQTPSTVLIRGESGTGKELLAQILHQSGPQADQPWVKIDCASLPMELLESELFGYEKGAFTGADRAKPGRLQLAAHGTLVLDEIAALSLGLQAKLLRIIEEKSFERLGGHHVQHIHARIVALTNLDLEQAVAQHNFREDLYYRLNVVPIQIPPLRQRRADLEPLIRHFLERLGEIHRRPDLRLADEALRALRSYSYPGNVRELRNLLERALIHSDGPVLQLTDFPPHITSETGAHPTERSLEEVEREHIAAVLHRLRGHKSDAARVLGISRKTLLDKRKRYALD